MKPQFKIPRLTLPNNHSRFKGASSLGCWLAATSWALATVDSTVTAEPVISVNQPKQFTNEAARLFIVLSKTADPAPRLDLESVSEKGPQIFARDLSLTDLQASLRLDGSFVGFPLDKFDALPAGHYFVQAVLYSSADLRNPNAPGNWYSRVKSIELDPHRNQQFDLDLNQQVPPERPPPNTPEVKFVELQSRLLSEFHHRPMMLRAAVVLPRGYDRRNSERYPLWVRIGGFGTRYTTVGKLMADGAAFRNTWLAPGTPRFLLLQLDGAGPFGDSYQINSANSGPYGDALVQELIPFVEQKFSGRKTSQSRILSGTSTGGWVALALQIFYPDFFNGAWASCPDPVDFRAFQLLNIYDDDNAYVTKTGAERASTRNLFGSIQLTMRREVQQENLLGPGNSYTLSGRQWGAWNAAFSPRAANGLPVPLWDPVTGTIDHSVADRWKNYDLRLVLQKQWPLLGPKLAGKLHIAAGEADQYFLNNAVHLLNEFLQQAQPPFAGSIVYGPGKGHGWTNLSLREMLEQMKQATEPPVP